MHTFAMFGDEGKSGGLGCLRIEKNAKDFQWEKLRFVPQCLSTLSRKICGKNKIFSSMWTRLVSYQVSSGEIISHDSLGAPLFQIQITNAFKNGQLMQTFLVEV